MSTRRRKPHNAIMFNMPLFAKKSSKPTSPTQYENSNLKHPPTNGSILSTSAQLEKKVPQPPQIEPTILKPQLVFHCQLAHGSPTGLITGFSSVKELYQKIAECYDFSVDEVSHFYGPLRVWFEPMEQSCRLLFSYLKRQVNCVLADNCCE